PAGPDHATHDGGLTRTPTGLLDVLERRGARLNVQHRHRAGAEPAGDLDITPAELVAARVTAAEVPRLVDELPLLALVAGMARGTTSIRGAAELRVKETDRVTAVVDALRP